MRVGTVSLVAGLFVILAAPYVSAQEYPVGAEVAEPVVVEAPEAAEGPVVAEDLVTADIPKRATQDTTDERDSICIRDKMNEILAGESLRLGNDMFNITPHTRIQAWLGWAADDSLLSQGDHMQESGFRLRRARFGVDGSLFKTITYSLELDVFDQEKSGGPLYQAYVDWTPTRWFGMTVGLHKFPFVKTEMNSSGDIAHLDRAIGVDAMAPGNTLGISLHSELWEKHLTLTLGVFNGLQRKASFFQGYNGIGISEGNKFERLSYVGRIDVEPLDPIGDGEVDLKSEKSFRLAFGGGGFYSNGKTSEIYGASGYLHMKAWGFHLLGEAIWDHARPQAKPTSLDALTTEVSRVTAHGTVGYMILKELLGLSARVEYINDNMDLDNEGDQVVVAATLAYYAFGHNLKVQLEYQKRIELYGASIANDSVVAGMQFKF